MVYFRHGGELMSGSGQMLLGSGGKRIVALTSGTSWTVPSGVTKVDVHCYGPGGWGTSSGSLIGGGGGAYAFKSGLSVTPGGSVTYQIGTPGASPANTWFSSTGTVLAEAGVNGDTPTIGGRGGTSSASVGDMKFSGGNGASGNGGGGGAAGPLGVGRAGGAGGGGGGAGGGASTAGGASDGGNGPYGTGAGVGGGVFYDGGNGTNGGGGGANGSGTKGGDGGMAAMHVTTSGGVAYGPGGGGGSGRSGSAGGAGGSYGGGGGAVISGTGGTGGAGLIILEY